MFSKLFVLALGGALAGASFGIVRRHDVTDQQTLELASANFKAVGLLTFSNNPSDKRTVTLINDRYILTAGHNMPSSGNTASILINGQTYAASNWVRHPNFISTNVTNGFDLAIAKLDRRVTNTKPLPLYVGTGEVGQDAWMAGYGGTGTGLTGANSYPWTLHAGTNKLELDPTTPNMLATDFDSGSAADNTTEWPGSTTTMTPFECCIAPGDSGGPVMIKVNGKFVVVGINEARGATDGTFNSDYGDISVFSRIGSLNNWIKTTARENGRVSGKLALNDFIGDPEGLVAQLEIRSPGSTSALETVNVPLATDGGFSFITSQRGTFDIAVKAPHWLRTIWANSEISDAGPEDLDTTQKNGDIDGDNEVGPGDFGALSSAFGSASGDANWIASADLDGDGEVGPGDFGILSANFGESGLE